MKRILLHYMSVPIGSGFQSITENCKWLYLLPSNSLVINLKEKTNLINPSLLSNVDVYTFDQLMKILTLDDKQRMLKETEQEIILKRAIEKVIGENKLIYFNKILEMKGWIYKVGIWLGEIKRAGISPDELIKLWKMHPNKYIELAKIYQAYQELIKSNSIIDHEEPYYIFFANKKKLPDNFKYNGVIVEQFTDFSAIQLKALNMLAEKEIKVIIHLPIDNNRKELYQASFKTIKYLEKLGFKAEIYEGIDKVDLSPIDELKRLVFSSLHKEIDANKKVNIIAASGKVQEIEGIVSTIKSLIMNNTSMKDIAVIVPQLDRYHKIIKATMKKAGIKVRLSNREALIDNPFIQSILSLLKAFSGQKKEWVNLILSPYFILNTNINISTLINIFRELAYPTSLEVWEERFNKYRKKNNISDEEFKKYNEAMEKIYSLEEKILHIGTNRDYFHFINLVEKEMKIKEIIKTQLINNIEDESSYRDFKAYEKWQEMKEEILSMDEYLRNTDRVTLWDWIKFLETSCQKTEYDFSQGKSEGVYVLQPSQIMGREFSKVFLTGLIEGEFPRAIKNDWLLPDKERFHLNQKGYLLNYSKNYVFLQKYQFLQSLLSAKEELYLVYSARSEEGIEYLRSNYIDECITLLKEDSYNTKKLELSDIVPSDWDNCIGEEQLINKIYYDLQNNNFETKKNKEAVRRFKHYQQIQPGKIEKINNGIQSEFGRKKMDSIYNGTLIDDNNIAEISEFISNKVWSTTQLNKASQCRYAYFAKNIIRLSQWQEPDESLSGIEKGDIFHRVLQRFFYMYKDGNNLIHPEEEEKYIEEILEIAEEEWNTFLREEKRIVESILCDIDWNKVKNDIKEIIKHELSWRRKSSTYFYPKYLELSFGLPIDNKENRLVDNSSIEERIKLNLKSRFIYLCGKIDRIDINDDGEYVIYDYKTGILPEYKHIIEGINLQLHIYLLVISDFLNLNMDKAIGAGFYSINNNRNRGIWRTTLINKIGLSSRVNTIDDSKWLEWFEEIKGKIEDLITAMQAGNFAVLPETDCPKYCEFKRICRKDEKLLRELNSIRK